MEQNYEDYIANIEQELQEANNNNRKLYNTQMSMFGQQNDDNLVKWQLDLKEDLDRIYHLLKGHQIKYDDKGNMVYVEPDDCNLKPFNEFGTQLIMQIMAFYLTRNTILSDYREEMIEDKVYDFGQELTTLIYCRYEEMMMTTTLEEEYKKLYGRDFVGQTATKLEIESANAKVALHLEGKQKMFMMIVRELVDTVHSAYRRAKNGGERRELRTARTVNQTEPMGRQQNYPAVQQSQPRQKSLLKPWTWA